MSKELPTRICLCGCGLTFKTLRPASFYSLAHAYLSKSRRDEVGELARKLIAQNRTHQNTISTKALLHLRLSNYYPDSDQDDAIEVIDADSL